MTTRNLRGKLVKSKVSMAHRATMATFVGIRPSEIYQNFTHPAATEQHYHSLEVVFVAIWKK